ncbi:MAG: hypothetical protein WBD64_05850 [Candidatus Zixiibacteriota bacterium]
MNNQKQLHVKRIREGFEKIPEMRRNKENVWNPSFKAWRDRIVQSLGEVFGKDHDYSKRFSRLIFWNARISTRQHHWNLDDQAIFEGDLQRAEDLLSDALEELAVSPSPLGGTKKEIAPRTNPQIVVNVMNVLSQTTHVELHQVIASLGDLGLSTSQRELAEKHAKELACESRGEQRWPVLAKSLDALKGLGKSVYERVAVPLLLEMLKKQAGV